MCACSQTAKKLQRIQLKQHQRITLNARSITALQEPEALRAALPHIQPFKTPKAELNLKHFTMTQRLAAELQAVAAACWLEMPLRYARWPENPPERTSLPNLEFVQTTVLTDSLLATLAR